MFQNPGSMTHQFYDPIPLYVCLLKYEVETGQPVSQKCSGIRDSIY